MNERLLQYIWQFQYFNRDNLATTEGDPLQILHPGQWNHHQGPDFLLAQIKIGTTIWAGSVEIHVAASQWHQHGHSNDPNFGKLILHVVWQNDQQILDEKGNPIPTLELQHRVSRMMLDQYEKWMHSQELIACQGQWPSVKEIIWHSWRQRLLVERLQQKTTHIDTRLEKHQQHWEEVSWQMICRYFGGSVNAESFEQIAQSLPITLLARHKQQMHQLEALLLGQAGLLHKNFVDDYPIMLYKEYQYLQKKYSLRVINKPPAFLRLRPANFPTIRLTQLANLLFEQEHLFAQCLESHELPYALLQCRANDYWLYHFKPDEISPYSEKALGKQMQDIIIINAIAPLVFAYGKIMNDDAFCQKAIRWLETMSAEKNSYLNRWTSRGMKINNAAESQAMLELTKHYCEPRRCLACAVGNAILKQ